MNTKSIPQQITLANLLWFNNMLINGEKEKDISRRHGTFSSKVEELFTKYQEALIANRDDIDTNNTLEMLLFLETFDGLKDIDKTIVSFSINYFKKEICSLNKIEDNITIDENVKTFNTVFNTRTLGYTKAFFQEIQKATKKQTFKTDLEIISGANLIIPKMAISDIKEIDIVLSDSTIDRRKSTLKYWQELCQIAA